MLVAWFIMIEGDGENKYRTLNAKLLPQEFSDSEQSKILRPLFKFLHIVI